MKPVGSTQTGVNSSFVIIQSLLASPTPNSLASGKKTRQEQKKNKQPSSLPSPLPFGPKSSPNAPTKEWPKTTSDLQIFMQQLRKDCDDAEREGRAKILREHVINDNIPPEALQVLQEALVSAAHQNTDEQLNEETARILASNFIQATAASAAASRQGGSSTETMPSSSSTNNEIPG